jgi:hypothetical protein
MAKKTHAPDDRRLYNNASSKLKTALRNLSNDSFTKYVSTLRRDDYSIWKPIKAKKKHQTPLPPIRKNNTPPGPWTKSDTDKVELFANHLAEVFTPHGNSPNPEVEREIATHTQPIEKIQVFTLQELTPVIKSYIHTGHLGPNLSQPKCYRKCTMKDIKLFCAFLTLYADYSTGLHP